MSIPRVLWVGLYGLDGAWLGGLGGDSLEYYGMGYSLASVKILLQNTYATCKEILRNRTEMRKVKKW
jgi:hypothetical protein